MSYIITSERVGTVGEPFTPAEGDNIEALIAGGFIKLSGSKSDKTNTEPDTEN